MNSREVIRAPEANGRTLKRVTGSHHHYVHADRPGIVTVPHPKRDLPLGTLRSIEKQSGVTFK